MKAIKYPFILAILLFVISHGLYAQGKGSHLLFNSYTNVVNLSFKSKPPNIGFTGIPNGFEGIAHAENQKGDIIFWVYDNGVFDRNHTQMPGSVGLNADPSAAEIVISPNPADTSEYYIFYNNQVCSQLQYSVVDMDLRGGNGDVTTLNATLDNNDVSEGFQVIPVKQECELHYDSLWLIAYQCEAPTGFKRYLIDSSGISGGTLIHNFSAPSSFDGRGELDYYKGRLGISFGFTPSSYFGNFSPLTGTFGGGQWLNFASTTSGGGNFGLEFSSDASKIYISQWYNNTDHNLYQHDIPSGQTDSFFIFNNGAADGGGAFGIAQMELGADSQIYIIEDGGFEIITIENPNDFTINFDTLEVDSELAIGISDHIQSSVLPTAQQFSYEVCVDSTTAQIPPPDSLINIWWSLTYTSNDDTLSTNDTLIITDLTPSDTTFHVFGTDTSVNECGQKKYLATVHLPPADIRDSLGPKCPLDTIQLSSSGGTSYKWYPDDHLTDTTGSSPLSYVDTTTQYHVVIDNGQCDRDTFDQTVYVHHAPSIHSRPDTTICQGDTVRLEAVGGSNYKWSPAASVDSPNIAAPLAYPSTSTPYTVSVTDSNNCRHIDTVPVSIYSLFDSVRPIPRLTQACANEQVQLNVGFTPTDCGLYYTDCATDSIYQTKIGNGSSSTSTPTPYKGDYQNNRIQIIYHQSELKSAGLQPGTITDIALNVARQNSTHNYRNFTIKMGCTQKSSFNDSSFIKGLTKVFGPTTLKTNVGWNNYKFPQPYNWNGQSHLVIEICYSGNRSANDPVYTHTAPFNAVLQNFDNSKSGCQLKGAKVYNKRPDLRFKYCLPAADSLDITWEPSIGLSADTIASPYYFLDQDKTFKVTLSDSLCQDSARAEVDIIPQPPVEAQDTATCVDNTVRIPTAPDSGAYRYYWTPNNASIGDTQSATPIVTSTIATEERYYLKVIDTTGGCTTQDTVQITFNKKPHLTAYPDTGVCAGKKVQLNATNDTSYRYRWWPYNALSDTNSPSPIVHTKNSASHPQETTYYIQVMDSNSCYQLDSVRITTFPHPTVDAGPDQHINISESVQLQANSSAENYQWRPNEHLSCNTCLVPTAQPKTPTMYHLNVSNSYGCQGQDSVLVKVSYPPLSMPNAFTPNGDGTNVIIRPGGGYMVNFEYRIYNRWGELIFQTNDPEKGWDGTHHANGEPQPVGTYVYYVRATVRKEETGELAQKTLKGNITLIR